MSTLIPGLAARLKTATANLGSVLVAFMRLAAGAIARTVHDKLSERVSVLDFGADSTGVADATAAFSAAIAYLVALGGGVLYVPRGTYLLNGAAGLDAFKNGVLVPDTNGDFATRKAIHIRGEGNETVLKAGSAGMMMIRAARTYTVIRDLRIDGNGKANVRAVAWAPESLTQTTELVSQSYGSMVGVDVEGCDEGLYFQPGPTVAGPQDSGAFYYSIEGCRFNLNKRCVWAVADVTGANNRITRTTFFKCTFLRGNTGIQIDAGTEIDLIACNFEMFKATTYGTLPNATAIAINYAAANAGNFRVIGGYAEACDKAIVALHPEQVQLIGFQHSSVPDSSQALMGQHITGRLVVAKLTNLLAYLAFGNASYIALMADPDQDGSKTLELQLNGAAKTRWAAAGWMRHYGSLGTITMEASGIELTFSRPAGSSITSAGAFTYSATWHNFNSAAGANLATIDDNGLILQGSTVAIRVQRTPASATAAGVKGDWCHDTGFVYVCTANNVWKRATLATW